MKKDTYASILFRKEHIPIQLITITLLVFTFWIWFGVPLYVVPYIENFGKVFITGLMTAGMVTILLAPLQMTVAKRMKERLSWKQEFFRYSRNAFISTYIIYVALFLASILSISVSEEIYMKLSGVISIAAFLIIGLSFIVFVVSLLSDDSSKGLTILGCILLIFNGLIALGVVELLEKAEKIETKIQ